MNTLNAVTRDPAGDLQIFSLTLSQLSYRGLWARWQQLRWSLAAPPKPRPIFCHEAVASAAGVAVVLGAAGARARTPDGASRNNGATRGARAAR